MEERLEAVDQHRTERQAVTRIPGEALRLATQRLAPGARSRLVVQLARQPRLHLRPQRRIAVAESCQRLLELADRRRLGHVPQGAADESRPRGADVVAETTGHGDRLAGPRARPRAVAAALEALRQLYEDVVAPPQPSLRVGPGAGRYHAQRPLQVYRGALVGTRRVRLARRPQRPGDGLVGERRIRRTRQVEGDLGHPAVAIPRLGFDRPAERRVQPRPPRAAQTRAQNLRRQRVAEAEAARGSRQLFDHGACHRFLERFEDLRLGPVDRPRHRRQLELHPLHRRSGKHRLCPR